MDHSKHTELVPMLQQRLRSSGPEGTPWEVATAFCCRSQEPWSVTSFPTCCSWPSGAGHVGCSRKEMKRVLFVTIEAVQNVIHHGYIDPLGTSPFT